MPGIKEGMLLKKHGCNDFTNVPFVKASLNVPVKRKKNESLAPEPVIKDGKRNYLKRHIKIPMIL